MPSLEALIASDMEVAAAVTNPDRPAGRGMELQASPVKKVARAAGLEVLQPERARDPGLATRLIEIAPDVATVVAYGSILPGTLLLVPPLGFVNVHFSLLPAFRGAAPVQRALIEGCRETGVSIMVLTEGMDEGPVLARRAVTVGATETAGELGERLAGIGAELLVTTLPRYAAGDLVPEPQDDAAATYAPKVTTAEARIDWSRPAPRIAGLVRALNPAPGAWTTFRGARLKLFATEAVTGAGGLAPGAIGEQPGLVVGTGSDPLALTDVQMAGKRRMSGEELARGLRPEPGERLD